MCKIVRVCLALSAVWCVVRGSGIGRCPNYAPLPQFDIKGMVGVWYEVERSFGLSELVASCTTIEFEIMRKTGQLIVNATTLHRWTNTPTSSVGVGVPTAPDSSVFRFKPYQFRVPFPIAKFMLPGVGTYKVIHTDYHSYAILWSCTSFTLAHVDQIWLIGRKRDFPAPLRFQIYSVMRTLGLDPERLLLSKNIDCPF